ncbi:MAG: hypothetical protein M8364_18735 [Methylobacter sp.]|uniref:CdiA family toxin C-terminal domain-containing protein n=1 Tax=Methylobacter sp. TaxID=2051955 RepID=UPI00258BD043|nr:CdiA family toxin C-terminal domain-containing protein [Methylobacter sp.]MCL7422931.1 hypothetical protein [Methylobacter sp.]
MPNDPYKNPFESWHRQRCHPNAPAGGGGPGNFTSAGPLGSSDQGRASLPHPNSPAGRYLTHQEIRTPALHERVEYVVKAYFLALRLAPGAVYQETGYQLGQVIEALLPGLLQMLAVLGISVVAGAGVGAAIGFFLGGVGAVPGAVVGAELGLEIGTAVLAWMGLGFLAVAIGQGMGELTGVLTHAIRRAWHAAERHHPQFETDRAAEGLAQAVGILFRLILQGLLAYVLKKGAVSSSQAALSTAQTISRGGTGGAADATLAEVSALLRKSKLPDGFVVWIERNWEDLKRNPKLTSNKTGPNSSSQASSSVATPSELKAMKGKQRGNDVAENSGNKSQPVVERTAHGRMTEKDYSEGLAYRSDLPEHLFGPHGFKKDGALHGTHNQINAINALVEKGATYELTPTSTQGISELNYKYFNEAKGKYVTGRKTVYDPDIYTDQVILDMSQNVGQKAFEMYKNGNVQKFYDLTENEVKFRAYINVDSKTNAPYVGNVHPVK